MLMKPDDAAYFEAHKSTLLAMKEAAIASIPLKRAIRKMEYNCPCGTIIGCKQLQYHFISKKHRKVCGDLPTPPQAHQSSSEDSGSSIPSFASSKL